MKKILVFGGFGFLGHYLVHELLNRGYEVTVADIHENEKLKSEITFIKCDITDIGALKSAILDASKANGGINVLINNAANDTRHTLDDMTTEEWDQSININLRPHFFTAQAVAPFMRTQGGGSIINFSSNSYMMGNAGLPAYVTSKAGITGLTRSLARELGVDGIRVNTLIPGWVLTERQLKLWANEKDLAIHMDKQCIKEHLLPNDLIDSTLFLASNASRMMTGQALVIDGGVVVTG